MSRFPICLLRFLLRLPALTHVGRFPLVAGANGNRHGGHRSLKVRLPRLSRCRLAPTSHLIPTHSTRCFVYSIFYRTQRQVCIVATTLFSLHSGLLRLLCSHWPRLFLSLPYLTQALVLCSCQSQTPTVVHNGWAIQRIRQFYTRTSFASGSKSEQHFWYHLIFSLLCCTTLYRQGEIHIIEHCGSSRSHPNQFSEGM